MQKSPNETRKTSAPHRIVFVTFFASCANVHLTKDVGMIPYILHRNYGYDSYIMCYKNGEYPSLSSEVPGLRLLFMKPKTLPVLRAMTRPVSEGDGILAQIGRWPLTLLDAILTFLDALPLIAKHAKNIDVLHLFHLRYESIILALFYRLVNSNGILYLKLDFNPDSMGIYQRHPHKRITDLLLYPVFRMICFDIISVESRKLRDFIRRSHPLLSRFADRLHHIPNGIDLNRLSQFKRIFEAKENNILHVGRIGAPEKRSDIVLEVFARVSPQYPDWKLVLVGPLARPFNNYFQEFVDRNPSVRHRILHVGPIQRDREKLYELYSKSKILAFPSRSESFGFVTIEAGCLGTTVLGSNILALREITNEGKFAYLCPVDDLDCFAETLSYMMSNQDELKEKAALLAEFVSAQFDWSKIVTVLHGVILAIEKNKTDRHFAPNSIS
jgi:glycosyltransferase involved in cell wall biosynthesis